MSQESLNPPDPSEEPPPARWQRWVPAVTIFIMGGCGLAYEYTWSKICSDLLGNSVRQWALIIAVMLFFMGMGAELQRRIVDRRLVDYLTGSQVVLALLGGFGPLLLIYTFAYHPFQFGLVQYGLISLAGLIIGLEIPLITRLNEAHQTSVRANLGSILKMDYIGALFGALFWTFLLVPRFPIHLVALILALLTLATSWVLLVVYRRQSGAFRSLSVLHLLALALVLIGLGKSRGWALHAEQALYRDRIIHSETSPYQHITLTKSRSDTLRCYINGHLQFSEDDEYIYHEVLVHPVMAAAASRDRVLILGGGDGLALREVLKYPEVKEVVLVDLDPAMTRLAASHPDLVALNDEALGQARVRVLENQALLPTGEPVPTGPPVDGGRFVDSRLTGPEVNVLNLDAARYVEQAPGRFGVIILDFPDPSSPELARLYSLPFYGFLKAKLARGGCLIQQSTSPWHAPEAYRCIGRTFRSAGFAILPLRANVPSFGEWGWWLCQHEEDGDSGQLRDRLATAPSENVPTRYLKPSLMQAALAFPDELLVDQSLDITTLSEPSVFTHYLRAWTATQP
ncbi:MAG: polyamine aminopropyltransferase [Verrucomicrobiota bacterium]